MKSLLLTLFYTKKGLDLLDEEFEDDLFRKSIVLFGVYGVVRFILSFDAQNNQAGFFLNLFYLILAVLFSVLMGVLFSYILFKIGGWLKGKGSYVEIFSLSAYSYLPIIIALLIISIIERSMDLAWADGYFTIKNLILIVGYGMSLKILIQGLMKFNEHGLKMALLNLVILIGPIIGLILLLLHLR